MEYRHTPVLLDEVINYLDPKKGESFIDCTLGGGGYALRLIDAVGAGGQVLAIDTDRLAIDNFKKIIENTKTKNIYVVQENFKNLHEIYNRFREKAGKVQVNGVVIDLGLSSAQLEDRSRGFSFLVDAPLNMAFGQITDSRSQTTEYIVNRYHKEALERLIWEYGEERLAKKIAKAIIDYRKNSDIKTTFQLVDIIKRAVPAGYRHKKIHFATRTFQALRIATNNELNSLAEALPQALDLLAPNGRLAVVAYHSLEDRIVKRFFRQESRDCICPKEQPTCTCGHSAQVRILTKKAVTPSIEEIKSNPRSRSAKLRAAQKI